MKKKLYGNYLGLVITGSESDPENRGRCQIYFPGVSNTLYKKINKNLKDLSFGHIDPSILTPDIIQDLRTVLPWSECAAPIAGGGTSAFHNPATGETALGFQETINPDVQTADIHKTPDPPAWSDTNANPSDVELPNQTFQSLQPDNKGNVDLNNIKSYTSNYLTSNKSSLLGKKYPEFGINNGTAEEWGNYFGDLARYESSGNINTKGDVGKFMTGSNGLFQLSQLDFNNYSSLLKSKGITNDTYIKDERGVLKPAFSMSQLQDPNTSILTAIAIHESQLSKSPEMIRSNGTIVGYFGSATTTKLLNKNNTGNSNSSTQVAPIGPNSSSPNPEPVDDATSPAPAFAGYSGRPHGVFSFPRMGAKLWAFFYGGDIQRPVYFAAAYEPDSIRYAIGASSPPTRLEAERDAIDAQAAADLPKDSTSEYKGFEAINQAGGTLESSVQVSGSKDDGIPFAKSSLNLYNLEGTGVSVDGGLWNIGNPANSGGSIRGSEEGLNINSTEGDIVLTAPSGKVKIVGNLEVTSGVSQKDQKKTEEYLAKELELVKKIANQQANDIAQGGEEISCPICDQKLADDKSDFVTKILRTIQKY